MSRNLRPRLNDSAATGFAQKEPQRVQIAPTGVNAREGGKVSATPEKAARDGEVTVHPRAPTPEQLVVSPESSVATK